MAAGAPKDVVAAGSDVENLEAFRERQRVAVADALIELVCTSGFAAVNVSDLVRVAGMSRKTFYKYFPSIEAALVHTQKMILAGVRTEPALRHESGLSRFLGQLRGIADLALDHPERMIFLGFFDFAVKGNIQAADREAYEAFTVHLAEESVSAFTQGQQDGSIDPGLPALETTLASTNAVFGLAQRCLNSLVTRDDVALTARLIAAELDAWEAVLTAR
ncbi:TetR/AcrR family transcriptional regulator [Streptomyces sp. NPDC057137]|uniref:TetR/AcrR family transcriptional regulator n=1 Tax=Streptomyces sp. NPDC057137 TaxID=3346030 RepID=UPI00362F01F7